MPNVKARIINKHDTEANWALAKNFKPLAGEVVVYDVDTNHAYPRFKVGDGKTLVSALPFSTGILENYITETELASALNETTSAINKTIGTIDDEVATHVAATNNPHQVTKAQVGLSNVDNVKQYSASNPPPYGTLTFTGAVEDSFIASTSKTIEIPTIAGPTGPTGPTGATGANGANIVDITVTPTSAQIGGVSIPLINGVTDANKILMVNDDGTSYELELLNNLTVENASNANMAQDSAKLGGIIAANYAQTNGQYLSMGVGSSLTSTNSDNVTQSINGQPLTNIFESNGITVKNATKATQDGNGNNIVNTYARQDGSYSSMTVGKATQADNATNADTADSATSAQDSAKLGGVAAASYARTTGTYSGLSVGYATTAGTATTANRATADASGNNIEDTYATKEEVCFPNLLINPDFKINQRGSSSYSGSSGGYTADRWVRITVGNLYLYDDHLELRSGSLGQYIEQELQPSTQYTLSVSYAISGSTRQTDTVTFTTPASTPTSNTVVGTIRVNTYLSFNVRYYTSPGYYAVTFEKSYSTYVNFYWVKLEQSPTATPFVPPNITTELLKCQRYYYRVPGRFRVLSIYDGGQNFVLDTIFFPVQMRTTPTISLTLYRKVNGVSQAIVSGHEESENFVTLWSNSGYSGYVTAECYLYYADAEI